MPYPIVPRPSRPHLAPIWRELSHARTLLSPPGGRIGATEPSHGDGPLVLLVPGFLAGDSSLLALHAHLARVGFRPFFAGIERNVDCSEATTRRLVQLLERVAEPVAIVGHSRGGLLARVVARRRPDLVRAVVTLAAPYRDPYAIHPILLAQGVMLGLAGTAGVPGVLRVSCAVGACCTRFRADLAAPATAGVRYLSVYSRRDAVVDWRACVDSAAEAIAVDSGHCGMAADPFALDQVVERLAEFHANRLGAVHVAPLAA